MAPHRTADRRRIRAPRCPPRRDRRRAPGAVLLPAAGLSHETCGQWIIAGRGAVSGRDLAAPGNTELLAEDVRMSLGGSRRDAESFADFLIRAACRDQLDDLPLAGRNRRNRAPEGLVHDGLDGTSTRSAPLLTERGIFGALHGATSRGTSHEARLVPTDVRLAEAVLAKRADAEQQLELVAEAGAHHLRPVCGDRERHLVLDERADRVAQLVLAGERLRQQVRGRADLEHDSAGGELAHQPRLARGEDPVADPVGPQRLDHLGDLLDSLVAALLADVAGHAA